MKHHNATSRKKQRYPGAGDEGNHKTTVYMSVLLRKNTKKVSKEVSWGKDQIEVFVPKLAQKQQGKSLKTAKMQRTIDDQRAYEEMEQKWMFTVLKSEAVAQHVLVATASNISAAHLLQLVFKLADIDESLPLAEGLKVFREATSITWEMYEGHEDKITSLLGLWRVKAVRDRFLQPGQHLSSTDTDESRRARDARWNLTDPRVVQNVVQSPNEIQELIASFVNPYQNSNPLAYHHQRRRSGLS